jgi:hypothetical protein
MNKYAKIAEGLAGWLAYERRCGRGSLLSESSLKHPLGDLLQGHYKGRVRTEVKHPVLASARNKRGRKPRIDFSVSGAEDIYDIVIEVKWASHSHTLLLDILVDILRLDLLLGSYAREAILILAGRRKDIEKEFSKSKFRASTYRKRTQAGHLYGANKSILPLGEKVKSSLRFAPVPPHRRSMYLRVLEPFVGIPIRHLVHVIRSGPFPSAANASAHQVYFWRILKYNSYGSTFMPEDEYPELCETAA